MDDPPPLYTIEYQLYLVALSETDNVPNATDFTSQIFFYGWSRFVDERKLGDTTHQILYESDHPCKLSAASAVVVVVSFIYKKKFRVVSSAL